MYLLFCSQEEGNHENIGFFLFFIFWQNRDKLNLGFKYLVVADMWWEDSFNLSSVRFLNKDYSNRNRNDMDKYKRKNLIFY